jgi:hypothetical protein
MSLEHTVRRLLALLMATLVARVPAVHAAEEDASAPAEDTTPPTIGFTPCETFQRDRAFIVRARFDDASRLFEPVLVYRAANASVWKRVSFIPDGDLWKAVIPRHDLVGALQYFVEAFDENGNGPARVGSPEEPLFARAVRTAPACPPPGEIVTGVVEDHGVAPEQVVLTQAPPEERCDGESRPFYCRPWVWYAAGGAVLATVGIFLLASSGGGRGYPERVTFVVQPAGLGAP